MASQDARVALWILFVVGISGLAAEALWIPFGILSELTGRLSVWDRALVELALTAMLYGFIFGVVVVAYLRPVWVIPSSIQIVESPRIDWLRKHFLQVLLLPLTLSVLIELHALLVGLDTPAETFESMLHLYPIYGWLVAQGFFMRASQTHGVANVGSRHALQ